MANRVTVVVMKTMTTLHLAPVFISIVNVVNINGDLIFYFSSLEGGSRGRRRRRILFHEVWLLTDPPARFCF